MRSEVLTAVKMSVLVFWVVTSNGLVGKYQHFWSRRHFVPPKHAYLQVHMALQPRTSTIRYWTQRSELCVS